MYYVLKGRCKNCGTYLSAAESNVVNHITVNDLNDFVGAIFQLKKRLSFLSKFTEPQTALANLSFI